MVQNVSILNKRIQADLRAYAHIVGEHARITCFVVSFDPVSDDPFLNYAIPDDDAEPDEADIDALIAAFAQRRRKPRLEYVPAAAPLVERAMIKAGFVVEGRLPIMICGPGDPIAAPVAGIAVELPERDDDIVEAAQVQARAFGDETSHPDRLRRLIAAGGLLAIARLHGTDRIVGVGAARPLHDGVTEIAGIGVLSEHRRRGIAGALTVKLASECVGRGAGTIWLTPGVPEAESIYARAGFVCASVQLHISKAPT